MPPRPCGPQGGPICAIELMHELHGFWTRSVLPGLCAMPCKVSTANTCIYLHTMGSRSMLHTLEQYQAHFCDELC